MRILLLRPPVSRRAPFFALWSGVRRYPLRLAYIASELHEAGATVGFVDCPLKGYDRHAAAGAVFALHPDIIYAELDNTEARTQLRFLSRVKELSATRIILGGAYASTFAETILTRFRAIDAIVVGEPDETLSEMLARLHEGRGISRLAGVVGRGAKKVIEGPPRPPLADLDTLPFPDRETVPLHAYQAGWLHYRPLALVAGTRGCPRSCRFCRQGGEEGGVRFRSPANVVMEVEYLVRHFGVREIRFVDAVFNADESWSLAVAEALLPCSVTWQCTAMATTLTADLLRAVRRSGCRDIFLNPVCPTEESAVALGCGDGPEAVKRVVELAAQEDVRLHVRIITGAGELPSLEQAQGLAASLEGCSVIVRHIQAQVGSELSPEVPKNLVQPDANKDVRLTSGLSLRNVRFWRERVRGLLRRPSSEICAEVGPEKLN